MLFYRILRAFRAIDRSKLRYLSQNKVRDEKTHDQFPKLNRKPQFNIIELEQAKRVSAEDITENNQQEKLSAIVLPLVNMPYDEQKKLKQNLVEQTFDQVGNAILWDKRIDNQVLKYVEFQEGNFCQVRSIIPSPIIDQYRAMDDLWFGYGVDQRKTVGFYINPRNSKEIFRPLCVPPLQLRSMKEKHLTAVKCFDRFVKEHPLDAVENSTVFKKNQYWRSLSLKSTSNDQLMATVSLHPQSLSKDQLDRVKQDLVDYFFDGAGRECEVDSMYFQISGSNQSSEQENPCEWLHGKEHLLENSSGKQFRILPHSFVHINKSSSDRVVETVLAEAQLDENTVLLDIGSGNGIYSIFASPLVKKIYSIEPSRLLIDDAKFNAKINQCRDNIEWISGFAESNLHRILKKIGDLHPDPTRVVAIVNPSRYSLSKKTTATLRSLPSIQRIVYIIARLDEQIMHNFYELASGQRSKASPVGRPFVPSVISPIDTIPHTSYCESVVKCLKV